MRFLIGMNRAEARKKRSGRPSSRRKRRASVRAAAAPSAKWLLSMASYPRKIRDCGRPRDAR